MYLMLFIFLLLTFSYKLVEILIRKTLLKRMEKYTVLVWAIIIIISVPLFNDEYIFKAPIHYEKALPIFGVLILVYIVSARFSGYNPKGKFNITNFIITYPIIEEIIFRGLILPNLKQFFVSSEIIQVFSMSVTTPVITSAILFAICHLQYYKLSAQSIRFIIIAFLGGILLGAMTEMTQSILFALILHIVFNLFSVIFAMRMSKE
ncbi:CPBP family intramembrane glutamic endopeptidase [Paenibacillus azoreducens]|uniref:CAAX prenyl protease 2/Lysostaphin resistance protein A-like domain-containing protein n=1 Tax=Paenibacillus azoreducens TaxID=116718 RepID=A0A919YNC6_9BACL|nr:CPBP family intramembrane glutamic endopeptidase [Paenibacillus azoreducens]GIO51382.1 hypothetical protein J34TS1_61470 [Paenibacillus azoreducens]